MFICFSFIQTLCLNNYVKDRCSFNMGHHYRHNAHRAAIILVMHVILWLYIYIYIYILYIYIYIVYIYIYVINAIFSPFYSCFDGLGKIWDIIFILIFVLIRILYFPNYNIYIQIKHFGVMFLFIPSLCWHRGTGFHIGECVISNEIPECHQNRYATKIFLHFANYLW